MAPRDYCLWWWQTFTTFPRNESFLGFVKRYSCKLIPKKSTCIFVLCKCCINRTINFIEFSCRAPMFIKGFIISNGRLQMSQLSQPFLEMWVFWDLLNDTLAISFQRKVHVYLSYVNVVLTEQSIFSNFHVGHLCISKVLLFQMDASKCPNFLIMIVYLYNPTQIGLKCSDLLFVLWNFSEGFIKKMR